MASLDAVQQALNIVLGLDSTVHTIPEHSSLTHRMAWERVVDHENASYIFQFDLGSDSAPCFDALL
jgi:hypothetical protein